MPDGCSGTCLFTDDRRRRCRNRGRSYFQASSRFSMDKSVLISLQLLGNATEMANQPEGVAFRAIFPTKQFFPTPSGLVKGIVLAQTNPSGIGVEYNIKILDLPEEGGPFGTTTRIPRGFSHIEELQLTCRFSLSHSPSASAFRWQL